MKRLIFLIAFTILVLSVGQTYHLLPQINLEQYFNKTTTEVGGLTGKIEKQNVVYEESVVTKVIEESLLSVVTVGIVKTTQNSGFLQIDPFNPFGGFKQIPGQKTKIDQNIGSGFIISSDGLIITNKHVVSDIEAGYKILTNDEKKYEVEKIYRDPLNDLAILKINASGLKALPLGDSSAVKLGQIAIAIGTPLGEFTNTVTTGIISGLGRGITAGSPFEGAVEKLDNVIQTDAAISPGNSGGPLLNSKGQVVGVNAAIAQDGQNIGFAIPVNVVKDLIDSFNKRGGSFDIPYLGIRYQILDLKTAIANELVEGAYVQSIVEGSPAEKAGIKEEDIITEFGGVKVKSGGKEELNILISEHKVGETVKVKLWRNGEVKEINVTLEAYK